MYLFVAISSASLLYMMTVLYKSCCRTNTTSDSVSVPLTPPSSPVSSQPSQQPSMYDFLAAEYAAESKIHQERCLAHIMAAILATREEEAQARAVAVAQSE